MDDELDEPTWAVPRTIVLDLIDLDDPVLLTEQFATTGAITHNLTVEDVVSVSTLQATRTQADGRQRLPFLIRIARVRPRIIALAAALAIPGSPAPGAAAARLPASVQQDTAPTPAMAPITGAAIPCANGKAKIYDCRNVDLLAFLPVAAIGGNIQQHAGKPVTEVISDIWGWRDPATQREFALVGRVDGTAFVEITDPLHPKYLGKLPPHEGARPSLWRDIEVYKNYAFIVSDVAGPHGMQVFDLTKLLRVKNSPIAFGETAHYGGVTSVHTITIDTATGFAYAIGGNGGNKTCDTDGGDRAFIPFPATIHIINIREPRRPTFAGCTSTRGHDAHCTRYHGPDQRYRGREICINAVGGNGIMIMDVTDKQQTKIISSASYPNASYSHQGWLSEDHRYFFLGDEGDETNSNGTTRTIILDLYDLDDPVVAKEFLGTTYATDHNLYVRGPYMYQANYKAGLRVIDIRDPLNPKEVGYFDTTPNGENDAKLEGAWSSYPYFKNGVVGISSISEGFFLVRFKPPATNP